MAEGKGLEKGLTNYGDPEFATYLRRSFAKSMGYSGEMLRRPIIGIATSASGFNNCHRLTPELVDAVKRGRRPAARVSDDLARRSVPQPHEPGLPEPDVDGC